MAYDVTDMLQAGENAIGAILGDGWAVGHVGWRHRQYYVDRPRLFAQLEVTLSDGETLTVATDNNWLHRFGPLLESDTLMGEAYDARLEIPDWNTAHCDTKDWLPVETFEDTGVAVSATNGPTVQRIEEFKTINISDPTNHLLGQRYIFDLGQNLVGWIRLKGTAPAGTTVQLRYAERLDDDGSLYLENLRTARVTDYYTFKGVGEEIWEPKFTFHGFRYVELTGYPGEIHPDIITGVVLHSVMEPTGEFECSDPLLNQLQHNITWGQKGNFLDVPTDCPQRDERLGWTGDIQVFARTAAFNMNVAGFMTRWLRDLADAQGENGAVPPVIPTVELMPDGGPAWADAAIICPWTMYLCYDDRHILESNYDTMTRFMDFIIAVSPDCIRTAEDYEGWHGFGDWLSINAETPKDLIGTAFLAYDAHLMAQIADVLNKPDDAEKYQQLFEEVKAAFAGRFLTNDESATSVFKDGLFEPTQTAYVLSLHFDLLPENLRPLAVQALVDDIEDRDTHLSTGFVGSSYLPHVLSDNGQLDTSYALLHQKSWPSWLYSVTQGATTIWERWDGWTEDKGFQTSAMNSFNHYAYGAIGAWMYRVITGIDLDPAQPGYKHIILKPQPGGGLTYARGSLKTLYGTVSSHWQLQGNTFEWDVVIPPNTTATVHMPDGQATVNDEPIETNIHELVAGTHKIVVTK